MAVQAQAQPDLKAIMEYAGKLRDVLPLHILEQSDKEDLAWQMHVRHFKADEVIYHQGDPAGDAHVVYQGLVKVMLVNAEGNEALVTPTGAATSSASARSSTTASATRRSSR